MTFRACVYEQQVTKALQAGTWPEGGDAAVRAHVETCRSCADLVRVAVSLRQLQSRSIPARLPSAGVLWWRAQLQRRYRAVEQATRPVALAERTGLLFALLCLVGVTVWQRAGFTAWWQRLTSLAGWQSLGGQTGAALATLTANWTLPLLIAVCSALAGLTVFAVYLLAGRE
jgi:hypothetical protein